MPASEPLLVACLCAAWCGTCKEYRPIFDAARDSAPPGERFVWVDIEDEADVVEDIDVENFPTLLVARGDTVLYFGVLTPQPGLLTRLLQAARAGDLKPQASDPEVAALPARVRAMSGNA
ncbi:thioredoxin family protein [Azohydromonas caseinilytica]|uniref:Thioredoxin family protein n=1 Tax=Azohydromonas caseinilytica TaxID=2728836 RepID=A0A848FEL8_9BURK|nr:thioredoxin family protein [Azohydromonas caseinilytica]NML16341.1 thioredoxin family protein [Azohydromonas caseinilytica]